MLLEPVYEREFMDSSYGFGPRRSAHQALEAVRAALQRVEEWCKKNRHRELRDQHSLLCAKLQGHYAYYGIRGNYRFLANHWHAVKQRWHYWLMRRSRERHNRVQLWQTLHEHFALTRPRIVHGQRPDQLQWSFVS